jgi:hypothetical protein
METAVDFDVGSSIFGEHSGSKAKRAKGNMARALRVPATPTSSTPAPSMSGTTPLSDVSMASPALSLGSWVQATPTPSHRPSPQDLFIGPFRHHIQSLDSSLDYNKPSCAAFCARLAEEVLAFTLVTLKNPALKDCTLPPGKKKKKKKPSHLACVERALLSLLYLKSLHNLVCCRPLWSDLTSICPLRRRLRVLALSRSRPW